MNNNQDHSTGHQTTDQPTNQTTEELFKSKWQEINEYTIKLLIKFIVFIRYNIYQLKFLTIILRFKIK